MEAPVKYIPDFIDPKTANAFFNLAMFLDWEKRDDAPRKEYYCNDTNVPYTYGRGNGKRTYDARPWKWWISGIRAVLEKECSCVLDVCFLNLYEDSRNWLGWHSDDSPEMDPARPIVSVSLGQAREIQIRSLEDKSIKYSYMLEPGSAFIMLPGCQQKWEHRIPKAGFIAKPRVSLTFRGYLPSE